jgi:hypothetical protein
MGYIRPTAIIVTGSYEDHLERAHNKAIEIFSKEDCIGGNTLDHLVGPITQGVINSAASFLIAWDGSKEGRDTSDAADRARSKFVSYLRKGVYEDGSHPLDWIEVQYGGDDDEAIVLNHSGD